MYTSTASSGRTICAPRLIATVLLASFAVCLNPTVSAADTIVLLLRDAGAPVGSGNCTITDQPAETWAVDVFHQSASATACRFKIEPGPGMTATYISETHYFNQSFGNTQSGLIVCYDGLCPSPIDGYILVATMTYQAYGTSAPCSEIRVVSHPDAETIDIMDCTFVPQKAGASYGVVQNGGTCGCTGAASTGTPGAFSCTPLPVEETTWGRVKALYRN